MRIEPRHILTVSLIRVSSWCRQSVATLMLLLTRMKLILVLSHFFKFRYSQAAAQAAASAVAKNIKDKWRETHFWPYIPNLGKESN